MWFCSVIVKCHAQRPQRFLGAEVSSARHHVVVVQMAEEGRPVAVEHPVHLHFVGCPATGCPGLKLGSGSFIVGELRLARELLSIARWPIATLDDSSNGR